MTPELALGDQRAGDRVDDLDRIALKDVGGEVHPQRVRSRRYQSMRFPMTSSRV